MGSEDKALERRYNAGRWQSAARWVQQCKPGTVLIETGTEAELQRRRRCSGGTTNYVVMLFRADTLAGLAIRYNVAVSDIKRATA
jgi:hypothetical protein